MTLHPARRPLAGCSAALLCAIAAPVFADDYDRRGDDSYRPTEGQPYGGSTKDGYPVPQGPEATPPHGSYKDDVPPPPRHAYRESRCLDKFGIQRALHDQGWHEFDNVEIQSNVAYMTARREEGGRYDLKIDSCSGGVIEAHPLVAYREAPPPVYYYPRPAVGLYIGGGYGYGRGYGYGHGHWR